MAHLYDNRMWSLNAKATLELEIEWGYQDMKDIPAVEGWLKSGELKIETTEEGTALKRLSNTCTMYVCMRDESLSNRPC